MVKLRCWVDDVVLVRSWKANYQTDQYARTCVSLSRQVLHARSRVAGGRANQVGSCLRNE